MDALRSCLLALGLALAAGALAQPPSTNDAERKEIGAQIRKLGFVPDRKGFFQAIQKDRADVVDLMLKVIDIQVDLFEGNSPLHVAAFEGSLESAKLLVERGANVNAKNRKGTPVLWFAISRKHEAVQKFLESKGAKLE